MELPNEKDRIPKNKAENTCYSCWFLTIMLAVIFGSLIADGIETLFVTRALSEATKSIRFTYPRPENTPPRPAPTQTTTPKVIVEVPDNKPKPGLSTAIETCDFWRTEYAKRQTAQYKTYMETACNRIKELQ